MTILEINIATESTIDRSLVRHKCVTCGQWFENKQLIADNCKNC